jgi:hypothetical protein
MTSYELFAAMPLSLSAEILEFNYTNEKKVYRSALDAVARARHVRTVFLQRQPRAERNAAIISSLSRSSLATAADSLIRNWLLKKHAVLLIDLLDALKIKHEQGIVENLPKSVDDATLKSAVEQLLARHPAQAVAVYLNAFNSMNAENWTNLDSLVASDERLSLKRES